MMAAISRAKIMAKPALLPTCRISSTGSRLMMANATAPEEVTTPSRLRQPDHTTRQIGRHGVGVDDGRDRIGGVVETVDELEAERDQQRQTEQREGADGQRRRAGLADIGGEPIGHIGDAGGEQAKE